MNTNNRMNLVKSYRSRQDAKRTITSLSVLSLIAGIILNIIAVFSSVAATGMSFYEYLQVSDFGITVLMLQNNPVLFVLSAVLFFAGFVGIAVNHIR